MSVAEASWKRSRRSTPSARARARAAGGRRTYSDDAPARVRRIRALLDAGLPTRVIHPILEYACGSEAEVEPCLGDLLHDQLDGIDARIAELRTPRAALTELLTETERAAANPDGPAAVPAAAV